MSSKDDMRFEISVQVDERALKDAKRQMSSVKDTAKDIEGALKSVERAAKMDEIARKFALQAAETGKARRAAIELADELQRMGASAKEIDKVSQSFANLAFKAKQAKAGSGESIGGAVASGAGTLSSVAGAIGIDTTLIDTVGQLGQAMKDAAASGTSLTDILSSGAVKLGALGAAVAALTVAFGKLQEAIAKANEPLEAYYNAQDKLRELYVKGATQLDVEKRIAELKRAQEFEELTIEKSSALREKAFEELSRQFGDFGARLATLAGYGKTNEEQLEASKKRLQEISQELKALESGVEKGMFRKAEQQVTALANTTKQEFEKMSNSGDKAKDSSNALSDALKQQQSAVEQARQAQESYNRAVSQAAVDLRRANEDAARRFFDQNRDAQLKLNEDLRSLSQKRRDSERDAAIKAAQDVEKAQRDHARNLLSINKDTLRAQEDIVAERDFLAFRRLQKENARKIEDAQQSFQEQQRESEIQKTIEAQDRQRAFEQERRDRNMQYRQQLLDNRKAYEDQLRENRVANQRKLEDLRRELEITRNAQQQKLQILQQSADAELQIASQLASALRGLSGGQTRAQVNTTNNISATFNNAGGMTMQQFANMLRQTGIVS